MTFTPGRAASSDWRPAYDAIVVGGGHNGLACAAYLARGGVRTLVLERRETLGGALAEMELAPGVRAPGLAHTVGRLRASVVRELALSKHGLALVQPAIRVLAPRLDGSPVALWGDMRRTTDGLRSLSARDAAAYPAFDARVRVLAGFLARLAVLTPPDLRRPTMADGIAGVRLGSGFRALGREEGRALLRVLPMAVADFVADAFEHDALRALIAARGIQYAALGPRSAGTTQVLLADSIGDGGAAGQTVFARGGPVGVARALESAARTFGVAVRTGVEVAEVRAFEGRAVGVTLASGEEIDAPTVVSGVDPKQTLLRFLDPAHIGPSLRWRAGNLRLGGVTAKVNLALGALPRVTGVADGDAEQLLRGRIVIAPCVDALERAFDASKYGRTSDEPYLEATIPTLVDQSLISDEARVAGTRHVMSVLVQYAPYHLRNGSWDEQRDTLAGRVMAQLERYAPGIGSLVTASRVMTPLDLERDFGLTEGHPLHGEPSLDQWWAWRPLLGHARYRMPLRGLYLAGSGAHPGGGVTAVPGRNAAREVLSDLRRGRRDAPPVDVDRTSPTCRPHHRSV